MADKKSIHTLMLMLFFVILAATGGTLLFALSDKAVQDKTDHLTETTPQSAIEADTQKLRRYTLISGI